jgi:CRISPR-associated protein Cmr1
LATRARFRSGREWEGATLDRIEADFAITTPLFLGDAEREASRVALASLKGALRFWWRAWAYPACLAKGTASALEELHCREQSLFGAAGKERENGRGQSRVLLRLASLALERTVPTKQPLKDRRNGIVGAGARYLGYGLMGAFGARAGMLDRSCFPGGRFTVELLLRANLGAERDGVLASLKLLGLLGGLGARSRRGWGSMSLQRLEGSAVPAWSPPASTSQYATALREVLPTDLPPELPPFTAFSGASRIEVVGLGDDPLRVLDAVGRSMQRYRAWGFRGQVNNQPSEENFKADHDWSKTPWRPEFQAYVPQRAAFGLPHNYARGVGVKPDGGLGRRASPLFIHVHKLADDRFAAVLALLPAQFLPTDQVLLTWPSQRAPAKSPMPKDWPKVLHGFFDGPPDAARRRLTPYFPAEQRTPVLP